MTYTAELYACLQAREFPMQAMLRLRPELQDQPCVAMAGEPPLLQVCSRNAGARALGIEHGMTRVEVDTFPGIHALPRSHAEESAAKAALLECAAAFSPRIEDRCTDKDFLCVLDIAGMEKLLGTPAELGKALLQQAQSLGIHASLVVSCNLHAAVAGARGISAANQVLVIPCGEESAALSALPIGVLDVSEAHAETLLQWGIRTLGMLAALPEKALIARLGQEGKRLLQLARGELPHLFVPIEPVFELVERMELDTPVELLDSLLFVAGMMLEQLIVRATARILALASVTITLTLEGGALHVRTVKPALPANVKQLWLKLIHLDLEAHPPPAAIVALTLSAEHGVTGKMQLGLFSPQLPEPMRLDVTLARIRAIVGEGRVGHARLKDTHRSVAFDSFSVEPFAVPAAAPKSATRSKRSPPRASARQLRPAETVAVTLQSQRPERFCFRQQWYVVEQAYGPWIASGDWWNPTLWSNRQWDLVARSCDDERTGSQLCCCLVQDLARHLWQLVALYD
jgi:protein ImuB